MNRKLLRQALDDLKQIHLGNMTPMAEISWNKAIKALEAELAKPEQKPVAYWDTRDGFIRADDAQYIPTWSDYYPEPLYTSSFVFADNSIKTVMSTKQENVKTSEERAQESDKSVHEPVAWLYHGHLHELDPSDWAEYEVTPLYKAPLRKEWVGLTSEELVFLTLDNIGYPTLLTAAIEAKLKEKNNA